MPAPVPGSFVRWMARHPNPLRASQGDLLRRRGIVQIVSPCGGFVSVRRGYQGDGQRELVAVSELVFVSPPKT